MTLPNTVSAITTLTADAGTTGTTTLVAEGATVTTFAALNANSDLTIDSLADADGAATGGANAKMTFMAQQTALALSDGTFVFKTAPAVALTSIADTTEGVNFMTIVPKSIANSSSVGATVKFTTAQPTAVETSTTDNGAFYAAGATTTALANTQIKTGVTYALSSGSGIANGTATGWVEQNA